MFAIFDFFCFLPLQVARLTYSSCSCGSYAFANLSILYRQSRSRKENEKNYKLDILDFALAAENGFRTEGVRSITVALWTVGQQVELSILHQGHDS